jgi:hypothetical protein
MAAFAPVDSLPVVTDNTSPLAPGVSAIPVVVVSGNPAAPTAPISARPTRQVDATFPLAAGVQPIPVTLMGPLYPVNTALAPIPVFVVP